MNIKYLIFMILAMAPAAGCSDDTAAAADGGADKGIPAEAGAGPGLQGTVKDSAGVPVQGAKVAVGGKSAYTNNKGAYNLSGLTAGQATVAVTQEWFQDKSQAATVAASGMTPLDITIQEHPLKIDAADKALAETYNKTFNWTKDSLSVVMVTTPSRKDLDNAVYYRNPALYRDTSKETPVTPSPLPDVSGGKGVNFTFKTKAGVEALDNTTIVDTLDKTPVTAAEAKGSMMFKPMLNWLLNAGKVTTDKVSGLNAAGAAVSQQTWGASGAVLPQGIEQVFVHNGELWVQVVFEKFVTLGSGVGDSDGDGRAEVYARLAAAHYTADVVTALQDHYIKPTYNTHGMSLQVNDSLNELYSTTSAEVEKYIAQPYDIAGVGKVAYPFVVLKHSGGKRNVLLVSDGK